MKIFRCLLVAWLTIFDGISYAQNLVPWDGGGGYARNTYQWPLTNLGTADILYLDGVEQSEEPGGSYDLKWRLVDCAGIQVGMADFGGTHESIGRGILVGGNGLQGVAQNAQITTWEIDGRGGDYALNVATAITNFVDLGVNVINLPWGIGTWSDDLYNACSYAAGHGVIICCAVPDSSVDVDSTPDYPSSFGFWNVISATDVDRRGEIYAIESASGFGQAVIGAPGRCVVGCDTGTGLVYGTGTSYACAHLSGVVAELLAEYPTMPAYVAANVVRRSVIPGNSYISGNLVMPRHPTFVGNPPANPIIQ